MDGGEGGLATTLPGIKKMLFLLRFFIRFLWIFLALLLALGFAIIFFDDSIIGGLEILRSIMILGICGLSLWIIALILQWRIQALRIREKEYPSKTEKREDS